MTSMTQNYDALKQICFATGELFEDPLFAPPPPPADSNRVKWLRPHQLTKRPKFIADGVSRFDVQQGGLGDCWMVSAMANLTLNLKLWDRVVPPEQSFESGQYCGLFKFCFWRFGRWLEVVVDDRLPVRASGKQPLYVQSSDPCEFWSPLLEKAYAKLYCSYEALEGGHFCEAMVDFTGGLTEQLDDLAQVDGDQLWIILKKSFKRGSMIGCSIFQSPRAHIYGLFNRHAYSVTDMARINIGNLPVRLLRIRNPHGRGEWNGAWSDQSHLWFDMSEELREELGLIVRDDGEFWMSFADWREKFTTCEICHLTPESVDSEVAHRWYPLLVEGSWSWLVSSGGHRTQHNHKQFATNPQFFVELTEPDEDLPAGRCTLVVSLMHKGRRSQHSRSDDKLTKGVYIYALERGRLFNMRVGADFFRDNDPVDLEPKFSSNREIVSRYQLKVGRYVIVPTTYSPGEEGHFVLRLWTEHRVKCVAAPALKLGESASGANQDDSRCGEKDGWISLQSKGAPRRRSSTRYSSSSSSEDDDDSRENHHYPGKPRIANQQAQYVSTRLASIPMRRTHPLQARAPVPRRRRRRRNFWRTLFGLGPAKPKYCP